MENSLELGHGKERAVAIRVLIAEDSRTQAEDLRSLLEEEGFETEVAVNGREALEKVRMIRPDLILSDLFMPEMDGFAFCQAIKNDAEARTIPFILLTQLNTPGGIAIGLQHGADEFIAKPYDEGILLERIRALLATASGSAARPEPGLEKLPLERASLLLDRREQALRASHDFLEQLIAASPGIVVRGEARTQALSYVSPNIEPVLGYRVEEVLNTPNFFLDRMPLDERDVVLNSVCQAHADGLEQWDSECRFRHQDGNYRWFYLSVRFEHNLREQQVPLVAHLLDITPRKDAEARLQQLNESLERQVAERTAAAEERARELARSETALRQTNAMLRTLIASAPLAILGTDMEGRVTLWNPAAERILEWREEEVLGGPLPSLAETAADEFERMFSAARQGERLYNLELRCRKKDGTPVDVRLWTAPLYADAGQITGAIAMVEDITLHKQLEAQLRQAQKMEAVGQLAGGVAHDFNNMLAVINGYTELLLMKPDLAPSVRSYLEEIQRAGERSGGLTRQLLAFSRQQVLEPKIVDLSAIAEGAASMLRRLIGEDIELTTRLEPDLGPVMVDPGQIEQVLMNLAVNARDAMPGGGSLIIETRNASITDTFELPEAVPPGNYVLLSVADSGCGMTEEVRARLFEPFFTTKEVGKGTGLGLATVYGIITQSEGRIAVDSELGRGTTFRIYLPCVSAEAGGGDEPFIPSIPHGSRTVLLVEDEPMVRELVRTMLKSCGYNVIEATNPGEALHLCHRYSGHIDILLTDVVMPGLSGRELFERMKVFRPHTKVLFMSGYTDDTVLRHGIFHEEVAFIQKPFTAAAVMQKIFEITCEPGSDGS